MERERRKLQTEIVLEPYNRRQKLDTLKKVRAARDINSAIADEGVHDIMNNIVIHAYKKCVESGVTMDQIIETVIPKDPELS